VKSEERVPHSPWKSFGKVDMRKFVWIVSVRSEFSEVSWSEIFSSKSAAEAYASSVKHPDMEVFSKISKKMVK
jgi:hypothetical protein